MVRFRLIGVIMSSMRAKVASGACRSAAVGFMVCGAAMSVSGEARAADGNGFGSSIFPLFGEKARQAGHDLPRPFGVGGAFQLNGRDFAVDEVRLAFANGTTLDVDDVLTVDTVAATDNRYIGFVADAWILPFFNVFFIAGDGQSDSDVDIEVDVGVPFVPNAQVTADVDVGGRLLGGGGTLAGEWRSIFFSVGVMYLSTTSDAIDGDYESYTITPRIGYRFDPNPNLRVATWVGARYFDAEKTVDGTLELPLVEPVDFSFRLTPLTNWEAAIGGSVILAERWQSILELSSDFGDASSMTLTLQYRL